MALGYKLFFSRGAPTPSSRRTSATVRMGTQPVILGAATRPSGDKAEILGHVSSVMPVLRCRLCPGQ